MHFFVILFVWNLDRVLLNGRSVLKYKIKFFLWSQVVLDTVMSSHFEYVKLSVMRIFFHNLIFRDCDQQILANIACLIVVMLETNHFLFSGYFVLNVYGWVI
jgi:hypothetical protein